MKISLQNILRKKQIAVFVLFMLTTIGFAQSKTKIEIGTVDSIFSKVLNENRKIWIHLPRSAQKTGFAKQKYPVVYLLDGDAHFTSTVGIIEQLSEINGNTNCPEMIVVGITNTNRNEEFIECFSVYGSSQHNG